MKKDNNRNKLSLTKMNITKLTNAQEIWGGTAPPPDDGTDNPNQDDNKAEPKKLKCVQNSEKLVWE